MSWHPCSVDGSVRAQTPASRLSMQISMPGVSRCQPQRFLCRDLFGAAFKSPNQLMWFNENCMVAKAPQELRRQLNANHTTALPKCPMYAQAPITKLVHVDISHPLPLKQTCTLEASNLCITRVRKRSYLYASFNVVFRFCQIGEAVAILTTEYNCRLRQS